MKTLGKIFLGILGFIILFLVALLSTKAILSVSELYGLTFITALGFSKLYVLTSIYSLISTKVDNTKKDKDKGTLRLILEGILVKLITVLFFWGMLFIIHPIIT